MDLPRSTKLKMLKQEFHDFDLSNEIYFPEIMSRGMNLVDITNEELAFSMYSDVEAVEAWRVGNEVPYALKRISIFHTLEDEMEKAIVKAERWEKFVRELMLWSKSLRAVICWGLISIAMLYFGFICIAMAAQFGHPGLMVLGAIILFFTIIAKKYYYK